MAIDYHGIITLEPGKRSGKPCIRLVVEMQYQTGTAWVKFIGTHMQYDQINLESVNEY